MSQPAHTAKLDALLAERILRARRRDGHDDPARAPRARRTYRGERFRDWPQELRGNNDLLALTQPALIRRHPRRTTCAAGADIIETNTFNSTAVSLADYGMEALVVRAEPGSGAPRQGGRADEWEAQDPLAAALRRRRARTDHQDGLASRPMSTIPASATSTSMHWWRPTARPLRGLIDGRRRPAPGGNGLRHAERQGGAVRDRDDIRGRGLRLPGDDLGHDHRRERPHAVGPDDRGVLQLDAPRAPDRGRPELRARREASCAPTSRSCRASPTSMSPAIPNAGLPNAFGEYDDTPESMAHADGRLGARGLAEPRRRLLRHDAGAHARRSPTAVRGRQAARASRIARRRCALSGLEPFNVDDESLFVNVGERTNVTGSKAFARLILGGRLRRRAGRRAPAGRERRADDRRQHGRGRCSTRRRPW